jgi:predicted metal-dependent peptidase
MTADDREQLRRIEEALRMVTVPFPHFAGLARAVRVALDERVPTMGVFASGRLVANPAFVRGLNPNELVFTVAHELFHLALRTHDRSAGSDRLRFNYAHDYIINDILRSELGLAKVPAGGLDWPGARRLSAEQILQEMEKDPSRRPPPGAGVFRGPPGERRGAAGDGGDVLGEALERDWFPDEKPEQQREQAEAMREAAGKALGLARVMDAMRGPGKGSDAGAASQLVSALRGLYRTPWELALQRWLESVAPGERTFVRPSRRGADRGDIVLPGRRREGWVLNVVLDTSGSMTDEIPPALGAIADFCEAVAVEQIRLVQCDTAVTSDRLLDPAEAAAQPVSGYGGSDLSPALRHLAADPTVRAAVVLTDGEIEYPPEETPYDVLWVLLGRGSATFRPPYGLVIHMQPT